MALLLKGDSRAILACCRCLARRRAAARAVGVVTIGDRDANIVAQGAAPLYLPFTSLA
jgi:hypothetical protein